MAENESGTVLCQACGDVAHFNVTVTNPYVQGVACRTACRRACADFLARQCEEEIERTGGLVGRCMTTVSPILTRK